MARYENHHTAGNLFFFKYTKLMQIFTTVQPTVRRTTSSTPWALLQGWHHPVPRVFWLHLPTTPWWKVSEKCCRTPTRAKATSHSFSCSSHSSLVALPPALGLSQNTSKLRWKVALPALGTDLVSGSSPLPFGVLFSPFTGFCGGLAAAGSLRCLYRRRDRNGWWLTSESPATLNI